jgi:hypothetical protein
LNQALKNAIEERLELEKNDAVLMAQRGGILADPWQRDVLRSDARQMILNCSRQSGKSTVTAVMALHTAICKPDSLVLLVSPSLRQSSELFKKLKDIYNSVAAPGLPTALETSSLRLQFSNGSRVIALPGQESTLRGYSAVSLVVLDEASRIDDSLYYSLKPMTAVSNGKLILLSSPYGRRGIFYDIWENGADDWLRIKIVASQCPRISAEFLESERRSLPTFWFNQEYLGEFCETIDSVFGFDDIEAALDSSIQPLFPKEQANL